MRRADLDHPDELRVDLDPSDGRRLRGRPRGRDDASTTSSPSTACSASRRRAARAASTSTSGSSRAGTSPRCAAPRSRSRARSSGGCPGRPRRSGGRRSASASSSTTTRTRATAPSPAPTACARSPTRASPAALAWDEVPDVEPADLTFFTVPERLASVGDPLAPIDDVAHDLTPLLDLARRDEEQGLGDAPWPPNFRKQAGEPKRVQPSRARTGRLTRVRRGAPDRPAARRAAGDTTPWPSPGGCSRSRRRTRAARGWRCGRGRRGSRASDVDRALTEDRALVITWLNRGTLHLVCARGLPVAAGADHAAAADRQPPAPGAGGRERGRRRARRGRHRARRSPTRAR